MGLAKIVSCEVACVTREQRIDDLVRELAAGAQLYAILRQPRLAIRARIRRSTVKAKLSFSNRLLPSVRTRALLQLLDYRTSYRLIENEPGAYQIVNAKTGAPAITGDTWHLAMCLANAQPPISQLEVLYIGQTLRPEGVFARLSPHKKLQRIYADNLAQGYDVFLAPIRITGVSSMSIVGGPDTADAVDPLHISRVIFDGLAPRTHDRVKHHVDLVEAALISYFVPPYNEHHTTGFLKRRTQATHLLRQFGYTDLAITLDGAGTQMFTKTRMPARTHMVRCTCPSTDPSKVEIVTRASAEVQDALEPTLQRIKHELERRPYEAIAYPGPF